MSQYGERYGYQKALGSSDMDLVQLWVTADTLLLPRLQNKVMRVLEGMWNRGKRAWASTHWIPWAYEHTMAGSPMRNLAVDQCVNVVESQDFKEFPDHFPKEMLLDMAVVFAKAVEPVRYDVSDEESDDTVATGSSGVEQGASNGDEDQDEDMDVTDDNSDEQDCEPNREMGWSRKYSCTRTKRNLMVPEEEGA